LPLPAPSTLPAWVHDGDDAFSDDDRDPDAGEVVDPNGEAPHEEEPQCCS
jgi:hypothetical protein